MEDPWGSPWATNDTNTPLEPAPPRSTLELPGRTLAKQRSFTSQSPWATDDDGFSDWGTAEPALALPTAAATSGSGIWSGWGGENGPNSSQTSLALRARGESLGQGQSSPAWPAAPSPGLVQGKTLSRRSSARSLFQQPSPDPWSTEALNRLSLPTPALISAEQVAFSTLDRHEEEEEEEAAAAGEEEEGREKDPIDSLGDASHPAPGLDGAIKAFDAAAAQLSNEGHGEDTEPSKETREESKEKAVANEGHPKSSSHSRRTSFSDRSQHEERPDSPITSMDEESKDPSRKPRRQSERADASVEPLDGLVRSNGDALAVPDATSGRRRSTISIRSTRTDNASDFGDFEDAQSSNSAPPSRQASISGSPPPASKARRTRSLSGSSPQGESHSEAVEQPEVAKERRKKIQELREKFGPIEFSPNLEGIDKLFDVAKLDAALPSAKDYSLDHIDGIIKDSFTSVSERKTWWRISRHGTMRKHDTGDDDNYRRITWATSKAREETNKIVRRWMEQGSYPGGQASFGDAASIKGGAFNWNSRAEPLSMDQIFGKRKSTQHLKEPTSAPRPLSLQQQPRSYAHSRNLSTGVKSLPPRSPGVTSLPPPSPMSIPGPPRSPAFGWSTATNGSVPGTPSSLRPPSEGVRQSFEITSGASTNSRSAAPSIHEPESRTSFQLAPPPVAASMSPEKPNEPAPEAEDNDDEDEWGEMVASPSISRPVSGLFDVGMAGSLTGLSASKRASPAPGTPTGFTLDAVSSKLQQGQTAAKEETVQAPPAAPASHVWDFSAFDATPQAPAAPVVPASPVVPAVPPMTTSKPEFEFDTPLQSPSLSGPSRTASPMSTFQLSKPPTPTVASMLSRNSSTASFQLPQPPTPMVPLQPQHASKTSISSTISSGISRPNSPAASKFSNPPTPTIPLQPQHAAKTSISSIVSGGHSIPTSPAAPKFSSPPTPTVPLQPQHASKTSITSIDSIISGGQSRPASPAAHNFSNPPTPTIPPQPQHASKTSISSIASSSHSRPASPVALQFTNTSTSPVPFKPQHTQRSSLSMGRPSPLQKVLKPEVSSPQPMSPGAASPLKSVSFTQNDDELGRAFRQIVDGLPDLSYMLR